MQALVSIGYHPFIVELLQVHRSAKSTCVYVFEFMPDGTLQDRILHGRQHNDPISFPDIVSNMHQLLQAVEFMHEQGWMHRDIKPDNILFHGTICKLADFSVARRGKTQRGQSSAMDGPMSPYVATRWYRAPEILLSYPEYSYPVDVFSLGCIAVEMYRFRPLFAGENQMEQLNKVFQVLWTPNAWPVGEKLMHKLSVRPTISKFRNEQEMKKALMQWMVEKRSTGDENVTPIADLAIRMLRIDPTKRLTAEQALHHSIFQYLQPVQNRKSSFQRTPNTHSGPKDQNIALTDGSLQQVKSPTISSPATVVTINPYQVPTKIEPFRLFRAP